MKSRRKFRKNGKSGKVQKCRKNKIPKTLFGKLQHSFKKKVLHLLFIAIKKEQKSLKNVFCQIFARKKYVKKIWEVEICTKTQKVKKTYQKCFWKVAAPILKNKTNFLAIFLNEKKNGKLGKVQKCRK